MRFFRICAVLLLIASSQAVAQPAARTVRPGSNTPPRIEAAQRKSIIDSIGKVLKARYVDAKLAADIDRHLQARLAAGAFDLDTLGDTLAAHLGREMQAAVPDRHLWVRYEPAREYSMFGGPGAPTSAPMTVPAGAPPPSTAGGAVIRTMRIDGRDSATIARTNFGFARVERLEGNVGYLKLERFVPLDYSRPTALAAMAFLAHSDAVIIDLRGNIGGAPELVELILSYFIGPDSVKLGENYNRGLNIREQRWTRSDVPGKRMLNADLWVLIDSASASSAEYFAYAAKMQQRATLVGARTSGAGNGGARLSVGSGIAIFVPQWQQQLGPGWERIGVEPHVAVPADDALTVAHRLAREKLATRDKSAVDNTSAPARSSNIHTPARTSPATPLDSLSDEFSNANSLASWRQFHQAESWPNMLRRAEIAKATPGALYLEPTTSGWYEDFHGAFLFREVEGDFVVTTRLRASGVKGDLPTAPWSLTGLMVRAPRAITAETWTPGGEDWLFLTTGVAEDVSRPVFETKSTVRSRSALRLHPAKADWVEMRITRRGGSFELAVRQDDNSWSVLDKFERPDLPALLQVGINAYSDWYTGIGANPQASAFNRNIVRDSKADLAVQVDWVRFTR